MSRYLKDFKVEGVPNFEVDILEDELLQVGIRENKLIRKAFATNYTNKFLEFLRQKVHLREPINLAIKGQVRSGKSTTGIFIGCYLKDLRGEKLEIRNICANEMEFLKELKNVKNNDVFIIDESKEAIFGIGSMAKKWKLYDVMNIIAKNNISTIWITPRKFNNTNAMYGLRTIGRAFNTQPRLNKLLLYNLMENDTESGFPYGYIVLPHFADVFTYGKELSQQYEAKKDEWILQEQYSEGNIMFELQKKQAIELLNNRSFVEAKTKKEKVLIAKSLLPSEFTQREIEDIVLVTKMIKDGLIDYD